MSGNSTLVRSAVVDGVTAQEFARARLVRKVADVAALRALDKTKITAARVTTYAADTGAAVGDYLYDAADVTSAENLPYVVVATDGGRWKFSGAMAPVPQDVTPIAQITRDLGDRHTRNLPRQLAVSADNGVVNLELPLHIGTRRNLWQYTENLAHASYSAAAFTTKQVDTIVADGITLTRVSGTNFYARLSSNIAGLGLTPFVLGELYLVSCYVHCRGSVEQFVWMRELANGGSFGHGAKLLVPNRTRRIWVLAKAVSTTTLDLLPTPTVAYGAGAAVTPSWFFQGNTEGGAFEVFAGAFMFEKLASNAYRDGIAMIGDSTMAGSSAGFDSCATNAREVSVWLGALLNVNVFNRAVGGERTDNMDARWAADITPLAINCKYAVIQGGINDIAGGARTLANIQASIASMVAKAIADNLLPVLFTITPTAAIGANPTYEALRQSVNDWMKATYPRVIDIAAVVADPNNPASLRRAKDWYGDGTHYGSKAKRAVAAYLAQWSGWEFVTPSPYQAITAAAYAAPGSAVVHNGVQVVGAQQTGWTAGGGTPNKGAFAADAATAVQAAQRVLALEQAMRAHGLIN